MPSRVDIVTCVKTAIQKVRAGRYTPVRGTVNWTKFPYSKYKFPVSIAIPEEDTESGLAVAATLSLVFTHRRNLGSEIDIDDATLEEMRDDAYWIWEYLTQALDATAGDNVFLAVTRLPTREIADADHELQGIIADYLLEY